MLTEYFQKTMCYHDPCDSPPTPLSTLLNNSIASPKLHVIGESSSETHSA